MSDSEQTNSAQTDDKTNDQASLTADNLYNQQEEPETPEDITYEFGIPENANFIPLTHSTEKVSELTTRPWEVIRDEAQNSKINYTQPENKNEPFCEFTIPTEFLRQFHEHTNAVIDEFKLILREEGIYMAAVSPDNVEMVEFWISKTDLGKYHISHENTVGMTNDDIDNVLKHTRRDAIRLQFTPDRKVKIKDGFTTSSGLIDPDSIRTVPDIPHLKHEAKFTIPGVDIAHVTKEVNEISDHILIEANKADNSIKFASYSDDTEEETKKRTYETYKDLVEYRDRSITQYNFNIMVAGDCQARYHCERLYDLVNQKKANQRADYQVFIGDELPIRMKREFREESFMMYILAPRVRDR